jgi:hypothetical protein
MALDGAWALDDIVWDEAEARASTPNGAPSVR